MPEPETPQLGHNWVSRIDYGAGPGLICERCGVRKGYPEASTFCDPRPKFVHTMKSDYNPFG